MSGANLSGADLCRTSLTDANLVGTNLCGACLNGDLRETYLSGANLFKVSLGGANLSRTNLGGIKLRGNSLTEAILNDADLTGVAGEGLQDSGLEINKFCRTQTPFGIVISNCRDK